MGEPERCRASSGERGGQERDGREIREAWLAWEAWLVFGPWLISVTRLVLEALFFGRWWRIPAARSDDDGDTAASGEGERSASFLIKRQSLYRIKRSRPQASRYTGC